MRINDDTVAEIHLLSLFNLASHQEGVKVHHDAEAHLIGAAKRLCEKGLTTQPDGGYLTDLGIEVAENVQRMLTILNAN
ncbi:TIGR02647 family protein [Methylomonas sp. SURF-2]|uniref:TIGR02647 family protein n=1 Tax=Methylomonas subterranea TaxID=2952225 RepID=A0ABT1TJU2_9GAMM|nr:TIGR02647 family protein [Methylomonas sp. SURF-2]MCQ8105733.1 TIGR02647 family protein [Methylomonas sp. SURF-2]